MAARRCSFCAIDYPTSMGRCSVCGEETGYMSSAEPHPEWEREVAVRKSMTSGTEDERIEWWRMEYALGLGYSPAVAMSLAASDADMHQLEALIRAECPLELAAKIV